MSKVLGCRVSDEIYYKIQKLDVSQSDFLRSLIDNYFSNLDIESIIDVNSSKEGVNSNHLSIDEQVDLILKHKND